MTTVRTMNTPRHSRRTKWMTQRSRGSNRSVAGITKRPLSFRYYSPVGPQQTLSNILSDRRPTKDRIHLHKRHFSLQTSLLNSTEILTCTVWVCGESRWRTGPRGRRQDSVLYPIITALLSFWCSFSLKSDESDPFFSKISKIWSKSIRNPVFSSEILFFRQNPVFSRKVALYTSFFQISGGGQKPGFSSFFSSFLGV